MLILRKDQRKRASSFDPVRATEHQAKFLATHTPSEITAPEWFTAAMDKYTRDTTQQIAQLQENVQTQIKRIERLTILTHNKLCGNGRDTPFEVLPFLDGSIPTESPVAATRKVAIQKAIGYRIG
ncbi:hypothetical protein BD779DRAFT_1466743 [Infundibulicybe gibba]|nr:hypothetical protein BD779DRAFT_1466743 [Infundibulicybe gibba]